MNQDQFDCSQAPKYPEEITNDLKGENSEISKS